MKITTYSGIGRRSNNEDYLIHSKGIYIVCDGVGGSAKGEVASRFVAETLLENCKGIPDEPLNKTTIQQLIAETQKALNARLLEKPEENGMGTTLTLLSLKPDSVHLAHIGDSRVYFIRPAKEVYWHTKDHSLVQELVDADIITEAKARTHPKKNHITRAIQANAEGKVVAADILKINEIAEGDLFFLCSDGVMEAFDDDALIKLLFRNDLSLESKLDIIKEACAKDSSDNNTAILIEIEAADAFSHGSNEELKMRKLSENPEIIVTESVESPNESDENEVFIIQATDIEEHTDQSVSSKLQRLKMPAKFVKWLFISVVVIIGIAYMATKMMDKSGKETKDQNQNESNTIVIKNDPERKAFETAKNTNTIVAFEKYLNDHSSGTQKRSAEKLLEELLKKDKDAWEKAKKDNTTDAYEKYLKKAEGKYMEAAKDSLEAIEKRSKEKTTNEEPPKEKADTATPIIKTPENE